MEIHILVHIYECYHKIRFIITDYSNSPDTSRSSLSSESTPVQLTNKSNILSRNDSSQLSDQTTRRSQLSKTSTG